MSPGPPCSVSSLPEPPVAYLQEPEQREAHLSSTSPEGYSCILNLDKRLRRWLSPYAISTSSDSPDGTGLVLVPRIYISSLSVLLLLCLGVCMIIEVHALIASLPADRHLRYRWGARAMGLSHAHTLQGHHYFIGLAVLFFLQKLKSLDLRRRFETKGRTRISAMAWGLIQPDPHCSAVSIQHYYVILYIMVPHSLITFLTCFESVL